VSNEDLDNRIIDCGEEFIYKLFLIIAKSMAFKGNLQPDILFSGIEL